MDNKRSLMLQRNLIFTLLLSLALFSCESDLVDQNVDLQTLRDDLNTLIDRGDMDTTDLKILGIILHSSPEYGEQIEQMSFRQLIQDIRDIRNEANLPGSPEEGADPQDHTGEDRIFPTGENVFRDYDEGIAAAKRLQKPSIVYFRGKSCLKCDLIEKEIWHQSDIAQLHREHYVLIYLAKEDSTLLPLSEQKTMDWQNRSYLLKTRGDKWSFIQRWKFGRSIDPFYAVLDFDEEILYLPPIHGTDSESYHNFLLEGKRLFLEKHLSDGVPTI